MVTLCLNVKVSNERQNKDGRNESELVRIFDDAMCITLKVVGIISVKYRILHFDLEE